MYSWCRWSWFSWSIIQHCFMMCIPLRNCAIGCGTDSWYFAHLSICPVGLLRYIFLNIKHIKTIQHFTYVHHQNHNTGPYDVRWWKIQQNLALGISCSAFLGLEYLLCVVYPFIWSKAIFILFALRFSNLGNVKEESRSDRSTTWAKRDWIRWLV